MLWGCLLSMNLTFTSTWWMRVPHHHLLAVIGSPRWSRLRFVSRSPPFLKRGGYSLAVARMRLPYFLCVKKPAIYACVRSMLIYLHPLMGCLLSMNLTFASTWWMRVPHHHLLAVIGSPRWSRLRFVSRSPPFLKRGGYSLAVARMRLPYFLCVKKPAIYACASIFAC